MDTISRRNNSIFEIKSTLEAMNSRLNDTKECINDLEDSIMDITQPQQQTEKQILKNEGSWGFSGGAVVENLPANAGDMGSSPGLGRSHMPRSN